MFIEKEIRNFTFSNGYSVQMVNSDGLMRYMFVNGTRFDISPFLNHKQDFLIYIHRSLGFDDKVQVKYEDYYCSLFMPDKNTRVEIKVTPLGKNHIYVTAMVNNAKVYTEKEKQPISLFWGIQDLGIYPKLRLEYQKYVKQHNFPTVTGNRIAGMYLYIFVQIFNKHMKGVQHSGSYADWFKGQVKAGYAEIREQKPSQPVEQPSNAGVIKHDVDASDIKISSVASNKDEVRDNHSSEDNKDSEVYLTEEELIKSFQPLKKRSGEYEYMYDCDVDELNEWAIVATNNKDVVSSMPDEKKIDDVDSFESQVKTERAEVHEQKPSQPVEQPSDVDVSDTKVSSDEDFGNDYGN